MKGLRRALVAVISAGAILLQTMPVTAMVPVETTEGNWESQVAESYIDKEEKPSPIIGEDISKREENVKYYRHEDGTYTAAVYSEPVHYQEDGEWHDIDNTLELKSGEDGKAYYTNRENAFEVKMPQNADGETPVQVEANGYSLSWTLEEQKASQASVSVPVKAAKAQARQLEAMTEDERIRVRNEEMTVLESMHTAVTYEEAVGSVDIRYDLKGTQLKESLILSGVPEQESYSYILNSGDLNAQLETDGSVAFYAADGGEAVFVIQAPYMFDSKLEVSRDIEVELEEVAGGYRYTITPDRSWLTSADRAYPVTIDPTITTDRETDSINATEVYERYPDKIYGKDDVLYAGAMLTNGIPYEYRTYIQIGLPDEIKSSSQQIVGATLNLYYYTKYNDYTKPTQINLYRVQEAWNEGTLTWNTQPSCASEITDYAMATDDRWGDSYDITELVQEWATYGNNYGVVLKIDEINQNETETVCYVPDNVDDYYEALRPAMYISYRDMKGAEDYWTYTSMPAGVSGTAAVNNANGNLVLVQEDMSTDGARMPVSITHVYNAGETESSVYGAKWQTNYNVQVKSATGDVYDNGYRYYLKDGDGTEHYFYFESASATTGKDEDGLGYTLTLDSSGKPDYITDKNDGKMKFNANGLLEYIEDTNGNRIQLYYDGNSRLSKILDGAGLDFVFSYGTNGKLEKVTDFRGREVKYTYSGENLVKITYPDGKYTSITYDGNYVKTVKGSGDGLTTTIQYTTSPVIHRVSSISYTNTTYNFTYGQNETEITSNTGDDVSYQFNNFGQTVGVINHVSGRGQYYEYGASGGTGVQEGEQNKLLSASKTQISVANILRNGGFQQNITSGYTTYFENTSHSAAITWDSGKGYLTSGAAKINQTASNPCAALLVQTLSGMPGGEYTLLGYINTDGEMLEGKGAFFGVEIWSPSGSLYRSVGAERILYTGEDEWLRVSLNFEVPAGYQVRMVSGFMEAESTGTFWLDDVQLETGETANHVNLLDNTAFKEDFGSWWASETASVVATSGLPGNPHAFSTSATPSVWYGMSQSVLTDGKKGEVISYGGWAKAGSAPLGDAGGQRSKPLFQLKIVFYDKSGNLLDSGTQTVSYNPYVSGWQFVSGKAVAPADYGRVMFCLDYAYNINTVQFALPYMYKEEFGQTYAYDEDGNLISTVDLAKQNSTFEFSGADELLKAVDPTGSVYQYTYSQTNAHQLESAYSQGSGIKYSLEYDAYGNAVSGRTEGMDIVSGNRYYIRTANKNQAVEVKTDNGIWQNRYTGSEAQQWKITKSGEYYTLTSESTGRVLEVTNGTDADRAKVAAAAAVSGASRQQWKLTRNSDGTWRLRPRTSSSRSLDVSAAEEQAEIYLYSDHDGTNQKFVLEPVGDEENTAKVTSSVSYTPNGAQISSVSDANGNRVNYVYNSSLQLESVTDGNGNRTSYTYDSDTDLLKKVSSGGSVNEYGYDGADRLTSILHNAGRVKYGFTYDSWGRSTSVTVGNGLQSRTLSTYTYTPRNLLSKLLYGNGAYVEYSYDAEDRVTEMKWNGSSLARFGYVYNADGNLGVIKDYVNGLRTTNEYDFVGRLTGIKVSSGADANDGEVLQRLRVNYDDKNRVSSYVSEVGENQTETGYRYGESSGEKLDLLYGVSINGEEQRSYTYDVLNRLSGITLDKAGDYEVKYTYAAGQGRKSTEFDATKAQGRFVTGDFNGDGTPDLACMYDTGGDTNSIKVLLGDGTGKYEGDWETWDTNIWYDSDNVTNRFVAGDFNGDGKDDVAAMYDYGNDQMKIQVFLSSGSSFAGWQPWADVTGYDAARATGRVVAGDFNGDGKDDIAALYDHGSAMCSLHVFRTNSTGTGVEGNTWDTWYACLTAGYHDANQVTGRMVSGDFNGDGKDDVAAMYDYGSNRAQIHYLLTNSTGTGFDSTSWHTSQMNTNYNAALVQWRMVSGDYDGDGKDDIAALYDYTYYDATDSGQVQVFRSTGTDFASKVWWYYGGKRAYDASKTAGLVSADYNGDGKAEIHALYDMGAGQANVYEFRKREDVNVFTLETDAWNSYAVLVEDENAASGLLESVTNGTNAAIRYTYDGNGNITEIHEGTQLKARYGYDSLNQLIREDNAYTGKTVTYTYDAGGNILGKTEYTYTTGELGSPTRSVVYGYTDSTWKDLLTSYDGTAITYDTIGNPQNWRGGMSFTWQNGRQLAGISKDGLTASYAYNDSGIRLRKTVNGVATQYFLNGSMIVAEVTGDVQTDYYYDESGNVFGFKRGNSEYYYIRNGQGDIIGILDSSGTQIVSYVYDSWGKLVSVTDASGNDKSGDASFIGNLNPFRYRGYYYDTETGLYYLQSRYYDPEVGRFLNADGYISGVGDDIRGYNLYSYCFNNPINMSDLSGHWPSLSQIFAGIAVVAVAVAAVAVVVATAGAATPVLAAAGGAAVSSAAATTAATVATGAMIIGGVSATAAAVTSVVENTNYSGPARDQSVYVMRDKTTDEVKYVGRTNDPARRQGEHSRDPKKANLQPLEVKFTGLTEVEARAVEQLLISSYALGNLANARREIASGNVKGFAGKIGNIISIFGGTVEDEFLNLMGR